MSRKYEVSRNPSFKGLIGVAQEDITPSVGIYSRNWGAAKQNVAEGIHQALSLTCMTFQSSQEQQAFVLIAADLGWWKNSAAEEVFRSEILEKLRIEPSRLMFCLSHTHAGPSICLDDASSEGGEFIAPYLKLVSERAVIAVQEALSTAVSATLTWTYGKCSLATNRDLPDLEKNRFVVGFNADQVADDTLLVGRVTDDDNRVLGTLVNYACHPTTLAWDNRLISPDYIGSMREVVESATQGPCLFLQGASGDLSPAEQYVGDVKVAERFGRQLGYAVLSTLEAMMPPGNQLSFVKVVESGAPLAIWQRSHYDVSTVLSGEMIEVELPLKPLPSFAILEQQWRECNDTVLKERLWRKCCIRKAVGDGDHALVGFWIWRLGDSLLIGQPNEAFSQFQIDLRNQLPSFAVGVMNIVNGSIGYLPPKENYDADAYAVWQTPFAEGAAELLTTVVTDVMNKLASKNFS